MEGALVVEGEGDAELMATRGEVVGSEVGREAKCHATTDCLNVCEAQVELVVDLGLDKRRVVEVVLCGNTEAGGAVTLPAKGGCSLHARAHVMEDLDADLAAVRAGRKRENKRREGGKWKEKRKEAREEEEEEKRRRRKKIGGVGEKEGEGVAESVLMCACVRICAYVCVCICAHVCMCVRV